MSDVSGHGPAPTDAELAEVRALLAGACVDEPVPADVAARLDDVLAGLAAEDAARAATDRPAVVPLRRPWAPRLLVAAAAVVVLGGTAYGIGRIAHAGLAGNDTGSASSSASSSGSSLSSSAPSAKSASGAREPAVGALPALRSAHFAADVRRALAGQLDALSGTGAAARAEKPRQDSLKSAPSPAVTPSPTPPLVAGVVACPGPSRPGTPGITRAAIRLDGKAAVLLVHRPTGRAPGASRLVQAWSCDGRTLLAQARVPVG